MPRFYERVKGEKDRAAIKISGEAVNLIQEELVEANKLITQISNVFNELISQHGFSQSVLRDIRLMVQKKVEELNCSVEVQQKIAKYVLTNVTGLGPIQEFVDDKNVTEIIVQRYDNICIERREGEHSEKSRRIKVDAKFSDEEHLHVIIDRIIQRVGRQINFTHPMVDARLEDGSRVNATIPPMSPDGATLTIRKFPDQIMGGNDYIRMGSMSRPMLYFLLKAVEAKCSIIASGGTAAGKTSLLNMLSLAIPKDEMIITIEDPCELRLNQPNVRRLEANTAADIIENVIPITVSNCVKNCLRMAPDRIVVGEIRDGAISDMLTAMSTGHDGSLSTIHANSPENLVHSRLSLLFAMSKNRFSEREQQTLFREAVELIVQIEKMPDGTRKVTHICEVGAKCNEKGETVLNDIFVYDEVEKGFRATGHIPKRVISKIQKQQIPFEKEIFDSWEGQNI